MNNDVLDRKGLKLTDNDLLLHAMVDAGIRSTHDLAEIADLSIGTIGSFRRGEASSARTVITIFGAISRAIEMRDAANETD